MPSLPSSPASSSDNNSVGVSSPARQRSAPVAETPRPPPSPDSDSDDDSMMGGRPIPATPNTRGTNNSSTPDTPLTPLSGLEDSDSGSGPGGDDDDDRSTHSNPEGGPRPQGLNHQSTNAEEEEPMDNDTTTLARGTDINVHTAAGTFRDFLRTFRSLRSENDTADPDSDDDLENEGRNDVPHYVAKLQAVLHRTAASSLDVDTMHLFYHNEACQRFYHQLVTYPMEVIPIMDLVVERELRHMTGGDADVPIPSVQVRPYNLKHVSNLRCLDPVAMDSLVCLKGMIVRASPIIPDLKVAHFSCVICGHDHQARIDRGRIQEPHQCEKCNTKDSFQLIHNRSLFADKQLVRLQETPDQVPAGQTPASIVTFCFDDLVDANQPGDKVEVTGVLRAQPVRVNPKISKLKSIYKTYVDIIHFRTITGMERSGTKGKKGVTTLTQDRIQLLQDLAKQPDVYEQLTRSLAPSIWELDDVKKGVLCMLFGGNQRRVKTKKQKKNVVEDSDKEDDDVWSDDDDDHNRNKPQADENADTKLNKRGDINILLCGDPGTSKSQLLSYVHKLSSRGVYTSGKGSSAVGLTASVVRDPETRDLVLESGALVLSDRGICCIGKF
jgi:DNA replication licensing factor MCM4